MNWVNLAAVAASAGVLTTYTDWLLAGDWIQKRFDHPEVWRQKSRLMAVLNPEPIAVREPSIKLLFGSYGSIVNRFRFCKTKL